MLVEDIIHKSQFDESLRLAIQILDFQVYNRFRLLIFFPQLRGRGDGVSFILPLLIFKSMVYSLFYTVLK
jgi:hypothetical protein